MEFAPKLAICASNMCWSFPPQNLFGVIGSRFTAVVRDPSLHHPSKPNSGLLGPRLRSGFRLRAPAQRYALRSRPQSASTCVGPFLLENFVTCLSEYPRTRRTFRLLQPLTKLSLETQHAASLS